MNKLKSMILFIVLFVPTFIICERVLVRKDANYIKQLRINSLEENSIDLIIVGSSHGNSGFDPIIFNKNLGLQSYNMGKTGARIEQIEFLLKKYLKRQKPKYLVIEGFSFTPIDEKHRKVLANWSFDGVSLSINKILAINELVNDNKYKHLFPIFEYHERWKNLETKDFKFEYNKDKRKGFASSKKITDEKINEWFKNDFSKLSTEREITFSQKKAFENIIKICEENNIKLFLITLPYQNQLGLDARELVKINNYLRNKYPKILNLDLNKKYIELKMTNIEFSDRGHLNINGAKKYSEFVSNYLKEIIY